MGFNLFGPATKCDIRVGYISTDRGFVDGINIYEANSYAQLNPGTQFIFRNRDKVQYLNINEVNKLTPEDMLPEKNSANDQCTGVTGLNYQGDTNKDISETTGSNPFSVGGSSETVRLIGGKFDKDTVRVNFYGGGGVGVQGNPIIGSDGSLMDVDVVHGGFGYKYPPIVDVEDDFGVGSGAVVRALVGGGSSTWVEEFDREEDFEEYDLLQCAPEEPVGYGDRFGPDGKSLGSWDPSMYIGKKKDPIRGEIDKYQKFLATLKGGARYDAKSNMVIGWWSTRKEAPLAVTSPTKTSREKWDVQHYGWGGNRSVKAVQDISPPPTPENFKEITFLVYTQGGHDRGLAFNFNAKDGSHKFVIKADDYKDGARAAEVKIKVKVNTVYNVVSTGSHRKGLGTEQGLITPSSFGRQGKEQDTGTSGSIFADLVGTNDDDDDLQIQAKLGVFTAGKKSKTKGHDTFELTYKLEDSSAFRPKPKPAKEIVTTIEDSFMNRYAISPAPPSSVKGSDKAGQNFTFQWEEEFPYTGDYVFKGLADNIGKLYLDNEPLSSFNRFKGSPVTVKKNIQAGVHKISLDLLNVPIKVKKTVRKNLLDVTPENNKSTDIIFVGLNGANKPINVINGGTKLALKDGHGNDTNCSLTITSGSLKFSSDGRKIEGSGKATIVMNWNDKPGTAGVAVESIRIGKTTWTQKGRSGSETHVITIDPPKQSKGAESGSSTSRLGDKVKNIFNTIDWIKRADRQLWKINPEAGKDAGFLNQFGVLPFDPTAVAEVKKEVLVDKVIGPAVKPTAKMVVEDGKTYLKVSGGGKVKVNFELVVNDRLDISGLAVKEVRIKTDEGDLVLERRMQRRDRQRGQGVFSGGQKYLIKTLGGSKTSGFKQVDSLTIAYDDDINNGFDENGNLRITAVNIIDLPKPLTKKVKEIQSSYPTYPNASTNDYAGTHQIVWNNINFPTNGNYAIATMVDDNATLTFSSPGKKDIIIKKIGFLRSGVSSGKSVDVRFFKAGTYTLKADLEQISGKPLAKGNPMALAIDVKSAFVDEEVTVVSAKSWNENPMGVALTIDAPMPPPPQETEPAQEGRCPNNPMWSTRFPAKDRWWPVRFGDAWSKFTNRYAISPIPPLNSQGSDGGGVAYRNSWDLDLPYKGFYGIKGTADNFGSISIDGREVYKLQGFKKEDPEKTMIYLSEGMHTISVEVENEKQFNWTRIDQKVFSTVDWAAKQTQDQTIIKGPKTVDVTFKVTSAADFANGIKIPGLDIDVDKRYKGPQINRTITKTVETGKVYEVEVTSANSRSGVRLRNQGESVLQMEEHTDGDWKDIQCSATQGKFYSFSNGANKATCKFMVPATSKTEIKYGKGLVSGSEKGGVSYEGPNLASYRSGPLGAEISPAYKGQEDFAENFQGKQWTMTWNNVDFPTTGEYDLQAVADDVCITKVDGTEVARAQVHRGITKSSFRAPKGKHTIELILNNIPGPSTHTFALNPYATAVKITTKANVAKVDPRTGKALGKPWTVNPIGVSAVLIPPPCPKIINGVGIVTDVVVDDPGNGWPAPVPPDPDEDPSTYPVILELADVIPVGDPINYDCAVDTIEVVPPNGAELTLCECGPFGEILKVCIKSPGQFTAWPQIRVNSATGVGAKFIPKFKIVRDPIEADPDKLIQVTDLVGLKRTGYYDGKPYYGTVFYKDGVRYAGMYETPGTLVQIYDTLQESIDAQVTTPPSAILRQGTDINSNDPRLNIPGTPDNIV